MSEQRKTYNDGLARAAQEVARIASFIGLDCDEGAAIAPEVETGTTIRAIFALMDKTSEPATASPSPELVERVARAICEAHEQGYPPVAPRESNLWARLARAAIKAMEDGR